MSEINESIFPGRRRNPKKKGIQRLLEISDKNDEPPKRRERRKKNEGPPKKRERGLFLTMVSVNDEQMEAIMSGQSVTINSLGDGNNKVLLGI